VQGGSCYGLGWLYSIDNCEERVKAHEGANYEASLARMHNGAWNAQCTEWAPPAPPPPGPSGGGGSTATSLSPYEDVSVKSNAEATVYVQLTADGYPIAGKDIYWWWDYESAETDDAIWTSTTDSDGYADFPFTQDNYRPNLGPWLNGWGPYAYFYGDAEFGSSWGSPSVYHFQDCVISVKAASAKRGSRVKLSATVSVKAKRSLKINELVVTFLVKGSRVGTAMTNRKGVATLNFNVQRSKYKAGKHAIQVRVDQTLYWSGATGRSTLTVRN